MLITLHNLGLFPFCTHVSSVKHTPSSIAYKHPFAPILPIHSQHIVHHDWHSNWHVVFHFPHVTLQDPHSLHLTFHDLWQMFQNDLNPPKGTTITFEFHFFLLLPMKNPKFEHEALTLHLFKCWIYRKHNSP
jgi:hypothetical protein